MTMPPGIFFYDVSLAPRGLIHAARWGITAAGNERGLSPIEAEPGARPEEIIVR